MGSIQEIETRLFINGKVCDVPLFNKTRLGGDESY